MKKYLIALLVCLALAGITQAAPVELKGSLGTEIVYRPDEDLAGATSVQLGLESQLGSDLKGVFGYRYNHCSDSSINDWYWGDLDWCSTLYAYVESTGSLWEGAEPVKMTMGSVNVKYSPYVAWFGYNTRRYGQGWWLRGEQTAADWYWQYENVNGVSIDNVNFGSIQTRYFYIFDKYAYEGEQQANTLGINFKGAFDDIDLDATFVKHGEPVAYDVAASLSPVDDVNLAGQFISDGVVDEGWYKFAVDYAGIPNWQLGAVYRDFTAPIFDFYYPYLDTTPPVVDGEFVIPNPYYLNAGRAGLILNAATSYAGYSLQGQYDYDIRTTQFTAGRDNWSCKVRLSQPDSEIEALTVLRGSATSDLGLLRGVLFEGVAEFGPEVAYGGSATYQAPNGLKVVGRYYNRDLQDDNNYGWFQDQGLSLSASFNLAF